MKELEDIEKYFNGESDSELKQFLSEMGLNLDELDSTIENYTPKRLLSYQVLSEDVVEPSYNYPTDSGFDLHTTTEFVIEPFGRALAPTGLKFDIPDGCEIQIRPKSGLSLKMGLTVLNTPGTIDSGYDGEVKVILFNTTQEQIKIEKGMKIAQAVFCPVINGKWVDLKRVDTVSEKDRGSNGFGSTGINLKK